MINTLSMPEGLATVPNYLTIFRVAILPLLGILILRNQGVEACWVLVVAGITDVLDGWLARKRGQETAFGKLMDPVADKILLCVAVIFLVADPVRALNPWMAVLLLSREFLVTGLRAVVASRGIVMGAGQSGKIKTFCQMIGLGAFMVNSHPFGLPAHKIGLWFLWIAIVLAYYSMGQYLHLTFRQFTSKSA